MRLAFLTYGCEVCGEEAQHYPTWADARRVAKADGWTFVRLWDKDEQHFCPEHRAEAAEAQRSGEWRSPFVTGAGEKG